MSCDQTDFHFFFFKEEAFREGQWVCVHQRIALEVNVISYWYCLTKVLAFDTKWCYWDKKYSSWAPNWHFPFTKYKICTSQNQGVCFRCWYSFINAQSNVKINSWKTEGTCRLLLVQPKINSQTETERVKGVFFNVTYKSQIQVRKYHSLVSEF